MLSLTTTSTRPCTSSSAAWANWSTARISAPASRATCAQLLVSDSAADQAVDVVERRHVVVAGGGDDHAAGVGVGRREEVPRLALGVDRDLVGDHVDPAGVERREDRVEGRLDELRSHPASSATALDHLDVEAGELVGVGVVEREGRVRPLRADADRARLRRRRPPTRPTPHPR